MTAYRTLYRSISVHFEVHRRKMDDVFALIEFVKMQLSYRHVERPGESYMALTEECRDTNCTTRRLQRSEGIQN